ncbi:TetR/AcrR family transcriptional regulator [Sphingobium sp. BYY-5]|uniref:TetR/AcrR family transcriptional regulator n=1 Tax=Sphingobium sp. BYY-5 TaxID=2926400 RepID=UPI001FA7541B|nr:TetR/AcrR family transcriptional regulator [Sphingobium sp. BYY-5]MCI4589954.1 TetR/AcrR family transcriptional regulator [Sphingobium sp. BYY-5]
MADTETPLKPRKSPVQARSQVSIAALHVATIQILTRDGLARCTTTRIAARAGLSVGSLYQYYPNRDALLMAVLGRHLADMADTVEQACRAHHGRPVADMAAALATSFLAVKLRDPEKSKALYAVAGERGGPELVAAALARISTAITSMLASAPDARFDDPAMTGAIAFGAMVGPVRALLEGHVPPDYEARLEGELIRLLTAYLTA